MHLAELPNPYEFANPVTQLNRFAGRTEELKDIGYYLRHARRVAHPVNLALIGERASGKTSLLNVIEHESRSLGLLVARINLNSGDSEPILFFWKLYEAVVESVCAAGYLFSPGSDEDIVYRKIIDGLDPSADHPEFPLRFPSHYALSIKGSRHISESKLHRDLIEIYRATRTPCVLLFDECNVLGQNRVVLEMLRNVFMNTPGYMLVLTGTPTLFPLLDEVFSPIIRQFKKIQIEPFEKIEETEACMRKPLHSLSLDHREMFDDPWMLRSDIHALSGGRPYEIQLLCHFMFRRVQDERAERMALTADVIDDVLRELENTISQGDANRPIISAVRSLTQRQLAALNILSKSSGHATLDELYFPYGLRMSDPSFSRQDLGDALEQLTAAKILTVDGDTGNITFAGDDFDRIYVRYHAESRDESLNIISSPYTWLLRRALLEAMRPIVTEYPIILDSSVSVDQAMRALTEGVGQLTEAAENLYGPIYEALPSGRMILLEIEIAFSKHSVRLWLSYAENSYNDPCRSKEFCELIEKANRLGGRISFDEHCYDLPDADRFNEIVLGTTNRKLLEAFGRYHANEAVAAYEVEEDERAQSEIRVAAKFPLSIADTNNIGYMQFSFKNIDEAQRVLERALELAQSRNQKDDSALAHYNLAMVNLSKGDVHSAFCSLDEASEELNKTSTGRYELKCLFIPVLREGEIDLVEKVDPELSEAIEEAGRLRGVIESPLPVRIVRRGSSGAGV